MTRITEIKRAIQKLPQKDYAKVRRWLMEWDWKKWDKQIEEDSKNRRLYFLAEEAHQEKATGKLKPL